METEKERERTKLLFLSPAHWASAGNACSVAGEATFTPTWLLF